MGSDIVTLSLEEAGVSLIDCVHKTPPAQESGELYIAIPQLKNGRIETKDARRISSEDFDEWTRKASPQAYDVVLSRRCNPGETAHVPPGLSFAVGQNLVLLRSDGSRVFPPFLRWLVRTPHWWDQVGKFINVGAVFTSLKCADVPKFELALPTIADQERLAHILGTLDDKIELNLRTNRTLEAMAQAIFKSWFVDFEPIRAKAAAKAAGASPAAIERAAMAAIAGRSIEEAIAQEGYFDDLTPSNRESLAQTAALFPDTFQDSELGEVPEGWNEVQLKEFVDSFYDGPHATPPKSESGNVFLGIRNLTGTQIDLGTVRRISDADWPRWTKRATPRHLDIVFSYEATLGYFALVPNSLQCCLGRRLALVRPRDESGFPHYLFHWLISPTFQGYLEKHTVHGATVDRIPLKEFPAYPIVEAPSSILQQFENLAEPIWATIHANQNQAHTLAQLRDTLLPKLLSGELTVPAAQSQTEEALV